MVINNANSSESIKDYQITWLQNEALKFNEPGWGVVFISHQPMSNHEHANISNPSLIYDALSAYKASSDPNKADIIGWFSGHIHKDRIYNVDKNDNPIPFTQVTTSSDHTAIAYEAATTNPLDSSNKSHCIDFVTIDKSTRTVKITRLGIGNDREYQY